MGAREAKVEWAENRIGEDAVASAPAPEWVRGSCPRCGAELVSNSYYVAGKGYLILWECWASLGTAPECDYRRVL